MTKFTVIPQGALPTCIRHGLPGLGSCPLRNVQLIEMKLRSLNFVRGAFVVQVNLIKFLDTVLETGP